MQTELKSTDEIVNEISFLSREKVKSELLNFDGLFQLDFTEEFLDGLSIGRLRHILLAVRLQQQKH